MHTISTPFPIPSCSHLYLHSATPLAPEVQQLPCWFCYCYSLLRANKCDGSFWHVLQLEGSCCKEATYLLSDSTVSNKTLKCTNVTQHTDSHMPVPNTTWIFKIIRRIMGSILVAIVYDVFADIGTIAMIMMSDMINNNDSTDDNHNNQSNKTRDINQ